MNNSYFRQELVSLVSEMGASEGEKSILIASHKGNMSFCSTFLETGSQLHSPRDCGKIKALSQAWVFI